MMQNYLAYILSNMVIHELKMGQKQKGNETTILEVFFVILTGNSSDATNDIQGPQKNPHHQK